MELIEYPDSEMMFMDVASKLSDDLEEALHQKDRVCFTVSGGTTPGPIYNEMCAVTMEWDRVSVVLMDERWVPESSDRSNARLVKAALLQDKAIGAKWVPLYRDVADPDAAIDEIANAVSELTPIDVGLFGMGTDMHTASIFPGGDNLNAALHGKASVVTMRAPGAPEPRITLSARVLSEIPRRHIVIVGTEKRKALDKAHKLSVEDAPINAILRGSVVHWAES